MKEERDKFLTEAMGGCWHERVYHKNSPPVEPCIHCGSTNGNQDKPDLSTPDGFFKLWEWGQKQEWWSVFYYLVTYGEDASLQHIIHPDRFADAVYEFLKGRDL